MTNTYRILNEYSLIFYLTYKARLLTFKFIVPCSNISRNVLNRTYMCLYMWMYALNVNIVCRRYQPSQLKKIYLCDIFVQIALTHQSKIPFKLSFEVQSSFFSNIFTCAYFLISLEISKNCTYFNLV